MSDEVDDLLRRAMATLDDQAPSEYFDTLADRTLARLDGPALAEPPAESSGHEAIRAVASETGARLGSRRSSQDLTGAAGDVVASASARWSAVALPAPPGTAAQSSVAPFAARAAQGGGTSAPAIGAGPRGARRAPMLAAIGVGLAAAAGAVIFVLVRDRVASGPTEQSRVRGMDGVAAPTAGSPAGPSAVETIPQGAASGSEAPSRADALTRQRERIESEDAASIRAFKRMPPTTGDEKPSAKFQNTLKATHGGGAGEPPLKEAGSYEQKADKPGLGRKQLSSDDLKRGMNAIAGQVRACFDGTQGPATVRLSVAPSGKIQRITMPEPFAGTPVGTCVERAVREARFPPWDGAAQRFDYLLE
jgi:hypothetical protein